MELRDDQSQAITPDPPMAHGARPFPDLKRRPFDFSLPFHGATLLGISLAYPVVNVLALCLCVGPWGLLEITNFYFFSFLLPISTAFLICLLRLTNVLRCHWLAVGAFAVWMCLIGYLNVQLFFMAWASV